MTGLLIFSLAGLVAITWWQLLKGKEKARRAASVTCREYGLALMVLIFLTMRLRMNMEKPLAGK